MHARVNGLGLRITENLDCALRYLRFGNAVRTMWVDAMCIHQHDLDERRAQVSTSQQRPSRLHRSLASALERL